MTGEEALQYLLERALVHGTNPLLATAIEKLRPVVATSTNVRALDTWRLGCAGRNWRMVSAYDAYGILSPFGCLLSWDGGSKEFAGTSDEDARTKAVAWLREQAQKEILMSDLPDTIYFIQERRGPTSKGPWSEWGGAPPGRLLGRGVTIAHLLTEEECRPRCMGANSDGTEHWRELRLIPYRRDTATAPIEPATSSAA